MKPRELRRTSPIAAVAFALCMLVAAVPGHAADWYMAGANPQRTSWVADQVAGNLVPRWYRPIEAYIDQKVQLIAVGDRIYVASSRGLHCLDARTGQTCAGWSDYLTDMPLGHSPTVVGGVAYVGCFDRRIHAVDAWSGKRIWASPPAGAGFSVNPVVVNNAVYAGSRDGYFYAFRAADGSLAWQYPRAAQAPLGPICYSPAYDAASDTLYFAADDNYAYALRAADGTLVWKSARKLPGDRFRSWWPVIYRNRVVFSGMRPYFWAAYDVYEGATLYDYPPGGIFEGYLGPVFAAGSTADHTGLAWAWPAGSLVMDAGRISDAVAAHRLLLQVHVQLDKATGQEYGTPFAPILFQGKNTHTLHPPVVMPDGVMYQTSHSHKGNIGITRAQVLGLHIGTSYVRLAGLETAQDEPQYISGGGNIIYRNLCCSREGDYLDISVPNGMRRPVWGYGTDSLDTQLPGFHDQVWYTQPNFLDEVRGWYHGQFRSGYRSPNGAYHNHGDQNPIVPHVTSDGVGRLFVHRNNVVICYANDGGNLSPQPILTAAIPPTSDAPIPPRAALQVRLESEIAKVVDAPGFLKPAYFYGGQNLIRQINYYFYNPGELLYTLTRAYPLVSSALQSRLRTYMQNYYNYYFGATMYAYTGWQEPVQRNANDFPPEALAQFAAAPRSTSLYSPVLGQSFGWSWSYPQINIYALWKYAQLFPAAAQDAYHKARSKVEFHSLDDPFLNGTYRDLFREYPFELHGYAAGYMGLIGLSDMVTMQTGSRPDPSLYSRAQSNLTEFLNHRKNTFSKDSPYTDPITLMPVAGLNAHKRKINLCRNFMLLVPEIGDYLHEHIRAQVQEAVDEYGYVGPYWFVTAYEAGYQENTTAPLNDYEALFQARALILKQPYESLQKYIDGPLFPIGDLFYINNLVSALNAPSGDRPAPPRDLRIAR